MHSLTPDSNSFAWHAIRFASLHCRYFSPPNPPPCQKRGSLQQWPCALSFPEKPQTLNLQRPHTWLTLSGGPPLHLPFQSPQPFVVMFCAFCVQHQKHKSLFCVSVCLLCGCACVHARAWAKHLCTWDATMTRYISVSCTNKDANFCADKRELERILISATDAASAFKLCTNKRKGGRGKMNNA